VFAFGFPLTGILASDGNFTSGMISALRGLRNSETRFQHTAPVQPGNSGGPLVDAAGNVIGVIVGRLNSANSQVVNFAVSQRVLERFLERNRVSTEPAVERRLAPPEIARLAQAFTFRIECLSSGSLAESARAQAAEQRRADEERERHEAERRRVEAEAAARRAAELAEAERRAEAARDEARREREREVDLARRERARLETEQRELEDRSRGTEAWNAFASRIGDALRSNTVFPGSFTPQALRPAIFRVSLRLDCSVEGIELTTSSGLDAWDRAVESAILRTSPFPALEDRRCPRSVTVAHTPIEAKDAASNGPAAPIDSATAPTSIPANARALPTGGWECRTGYVNYFGTSCVRLACPNGYVAYEGRMCVPLR
jgi:multidrug efflux pump subunit AcrA (membrane-fusion protein)